jgi:hypothetical protein
MTKERFMRLQLVFLIATFALLLSGIGSVARAELDKESKEALEKTQQLLRDPTQRNAAMKGNQEAQTNNQSLESLVGSQNASGVYDLSAEIFGKIVTDSNGDPAVMQKKIEEAQKNPTAFLNSLTPEQKARIKAIADQSPANQQPKKP